jgi:glycosyltransferase involved in cell wall biosynthesis
MQSWSIVIMCFNEEKTIRKTVDSVIHLFSSCPDRKFEIIIVDDGSTDDSINESKKLESENRGIVKLLAHNKNKGIGITLRSGYQAAIYENVCAIPGDQQFDVQELKPYLDFEQNQLISFYRLENVQYTTFRNILSVFNKKINHFFLGIDLNDVNWVKAYKTKAIKTLDWRVTSSLIESELCAKLILTGFQPIQVVSVYHPRQFGISKGASFKIVIKALKETFRLILIIQSFKRQKKNNAV